MILLSLSLCLTLMFYSTLDAFAADDYNYSSSHHGSGQHRYTYGTLSDHDFHKISMVLAPFLTLFCDFTHSGDITDNLITYCFDSLSSWAKEYIFNILDDLSDSYCVWASLEASSFSRFCDEIRDFLNSQSQNTVTYLSLDHQYNKIGFTDDSYFTFTVPSDQASNNSLFYVDFGQSIWSFGGRTKDFVTSSYPEVGYPDTNKDAYFSKLELSSGFSYVFINASSTTSDRKVKAGTYHSYIALDSSGYFSDVNVIQPSRFKFTTATGSRVLNFIEGTYYCFYDSYNSPYFIDYSDNSYGFFRVSDNSRYLNLSFSSRSDCFAWFFTQAGLKLPLPSGSDAPVDYSPTPDLHFPYDDDLYNVRRNLILDEEDNNNNVHMLFPANWEQVETMVIDPTTIYNISSASDLLPVYPSDLPRIAQVPELWQTKFPFCIPFDIYNLFSSWAAISSPLYLHFVIFPENFLSLGTEEIAIDVNFSDFNFFVVILRYCLLFSFSAWLIFISIKIFKK